MKKDRDKYRADKPKKKAKRIAQVQLFSEQTGKLYQLLPTSTVPALRINSVPMHAFVNLDPLSYIKLRIDALKPKGDVLDVCTGLGYCAIQCSKLNPVKSVVTIEKDPEVLKLAKANEASRQLFENSKIHLKQGDAVELIQGFKDEEFDCIFHDPPTFTMARELYSRDFYKQLFRVLKKGGKLWHYAPQPGISRGKEIGNSFAENIKKRLREAGFKDIVHDEKSCGVICYR